MSKNITGRVRDHAVKTQGYSVTLEGVYHHRVMDPLFECVRVVMSHLGEPYSPAYIQGISGAAFRIGGICPCAPTCSYAMETKDLVKLLGYKARYLPLTGNGINPAAGIHEVLAAVKDQIREGRPAILWHAFTNCEWDVVCGFDEEKRQFIRRGSNLGLQNMPLPMRCAPSSASTIVQPWARL